METRRIEWQKIKIDDGAFESAGVMDVNNNGKLDIVCGGYWYEAHNWTKHKICDVKQQGEYYDDFMTVPMDVNGDGYMDVVSGGWFCKSLFWRENPKGQPVEWKTHIIDECGNVETGGAWDIDGDGDLEIVPNTPPFGLKFYKLIRDANGKGTGKFRKVVISEEKSGHGLGFGDVAGNGKGRGGIVLHNGWWEAPADPMNDKWTFHQEFELGSASNPIIVSDFNGDGLAELIVGQAHGYGLDYYQQALGRDGKRTWTKHPIDPFFSQYHNMSWVDIDGDGEGELVTGNRYRAHCGREAGETDIVGLYYFKWTGEGFAKQVIDHGKVGDHSGTGLYWNIVDINGDGRLDIVAPGKEGLYLFINLGPEQVGKKEKGK
ncbi:MAG: VCBS repeat-containing protein [Planctomycetota bacterium]